MISAIADTYFADHRARWRRIINGALKSRYPDGEYRLAPDEPFECPELEPDVAIAAVFARGNPAVDLTDPTTWDGRTVILQVIANAAGAVIRAKRADGESADAPTELTPNGD